MEIHGWKDVYNLSKFEIRRNEKIIESKPALETIAAGKTFFYFELSIPHPRFHPGSISSDPAKV
ncbi:hypothetical protein [Methanosarcina siciliae]|uniref:hypothetical protein n=1 Tax=Methanosarcina siciliae TaxID=38027 RepID=UPI000B314EE1|nr:hypothetical protein [Methanosarcina siciliae]